MEEEQGEGDEELQAVIEATEDKRGFEALVCAQLEAPPYLLALSHATLGGLPRPLVSSFDLCGHVRATCAMSGIVEEVL